MSSDLELAIAAAAAGAAVVRSKYGTVVARHDKSATDFANGPADLEAERAILEVIQSARPADAILGEEYGASGEADASRRWLVDPLCGTLNFAAGTPLFSVNVALQVDGRASVAAIADPVSGEIFWTMAKPQASVATVPTFRWCRRRTRFWWTSTSTRSRTAGF